MTDGRKRMEERIFLDKNIDKEIQTNHDTFLFRLKPHIASYFKTFSQSIHKKILSFLTPCDHGKFFQFACPSQSNCLPGPSLVGQMVLSKTPINIFGPCQMVLDTYLVLSKTITLKTHSQVQTAHNVCFYFWFTGLKHKEYCHVLLVQ